MTASDRTPAGSVTVNGSAYDVFPMAVGTNQAAYGVVANYALRGPRGAWYLVTDHGPKYRLNILATGGSTRSVSRSKASPLYNLTRDQLLPFAI